MEQEVCRKLEPTVLVERGQQGGGDVLPPDREPEQVHCWDRWKVLLLAALREMWTEPWKVPLRLVVNETTEEEMPLKLKLGNFSEQM